MLLRQPEVLIIDGNRDALASWVRHFQKIAFSVMVALNARAGLRQAREGLPDLIILDDQTPGALAVVEQLRRDPATAHIPILMLLNDDSKVQQRSVWAAGVTDWLSMPLDIPALTALVLVHIRIQRRLSGIAPWERSPDLQLLTHAVMTLQQAQILGPTALQSAVAQLEGEGIGESMFGQIAMRPLAFAHQLQMASACERLRWSALGLEAIAERAGYADLSHFTAAFTLHFGLAPADFRHLPYSPHF